jgi:hypothetical protein
MSTNQQIATALVGHHLALSTRAQDHMLGDIEQMVADTDRRLMLHTAASVAHRRAEQLHAAVKLCKPSEMWEARIDAKVQSVDAYDATVKSFRADLDEIPGWATELAAANREALYQSNGGEFCMHGRASQFHRQCASMHAAFARNAGVL